MLLLLLLSRDFLQAFSFEVTVTLEFEPDARTPHRVAAPLGI